MSQHQDFDPTRFGRANVVDTCAMWNILSSGRLYFAAFEAGLSACVTRFVHYECLVKPRRTRTAEDDELRRRLSAALERREVLVVPLDIEDLQDVEILEARKRLGRGELSSIVLAKKVNICALSDDREATKLAREVLGASSRGQTTPRLLGWLLFNDKLLESDVEAVAQEHASLRRPLALHFREMVSIIARCRRLGA